MSSSPRIYRRITIDVLAGIGVIVVAATRFSGGLASLVTFLGLLYVVRSLRSERRSLPPPGRLTNREIDEIWQRVRDRRPGW